MRKKSVLLIDERILQKLGMTAKEVADVWASIETEEEFVAWRQQHGIDKGDLILFCPSSEDALPPEPTPEDFARTWEKYNGMYI